MGGDRYGWVRRVHLFAVAWIAAGCATTQIDVDGRGLDSPPSSVILLPVENASGAPLAGEKAEAILMTLLRSKGLNNLAYYEATSSASSPPELDDRRRYLRALARAKEEGVEIGVTGTVVEWRYRPGLDDEPAVSISLRIVEVASGQILWSGSGARGDGGTVGALAQTLLRELTQAMPLGAR